MSCKTKFIIGLVLLAMLCLGAAGKLVLFAYTRGPSSGKTAEVEIEPGVGPVGLADVLGEAGLIGNRTAFRLWLRISGDLKHIKAGRFEIANRASPAEIIETLSGRGVDKGIQVVIPEGFTLTKISSALRRLKFEAAEGFLDAATDPSLLEELRIPGPTAEGYLFPDTYYFEKSASPSDFVVKMHDRFNTQYASLGEPNARPLKEIVTLASIVQAEAKVAHEMPLIAAVFSNRLTHPTFSPRLLQADPTVAYGCEPIVKPRAGSCNKFNGTLKRSQLSDRDNPYNTYQHSGFPPGPICAPGIEALRAALQPAKVPYLYFVVRSGGRHAFSTTLAEHQKAVEEYRRRNGNPSTRP